VKEIKAVEAYPLYWPEGYKRTRWPTTSRFRGMSIYRSRALIREEVRRLGGLDLIISTNIRTRADGDIYSGAKEPEDSGVAVYFVIPRTLKDVGGDVLKKGKTVCLACDRWRHVWENTYAIAKTIDAMRGIERWGVSELLDRMFKGFLALPATINDPWPAVLKVSEDASLETIKKAYRARAMEVHPDRGGSQEAAARVNRAYEAALAART
jgi:hypothetical protein